MLVWATLGQELDTEYCTALQVPCETWKKKKGPHSFACRGFGIAAARRGTICKSRIVQAAARAAPQRRRGGERKGKLVPPRREECGRRAGAIGTEEGLRRRSAAQRAVSCTDKRPGPRRDATRHRVSNWDDKVREVPLAFYRPTALASAAGPRRRVRPGTRVDAVVATRRCLGNRKRGRGAKITPTAPT